LQAGNCNAFGITGADGNIIPADKRPVKDIDYGYVGDIDVQKINTKTIISLLENKFVPVFAPITHDNHGQLLNTNADTIASSLAISMANDFKVNLIFCFEKRGVLMNNEDSDSFLNGIDENTFRNYKTQGIIHSGMIPKLENAFSALKQGVSKINICGPGAFSPDKFIGGTNVVL
jgi:acetylglutamate kinase